MGKEPLSTSGLSCLVKDCKLPIDVFLLSSEGAHRKLLEIFNPELAIIKPEDRRQLAVVKLWETAKIVTLLVEFSHNYSHTHLATRSIDTVFDFVVAAKKYGNQFAVEACEAAMDVLADSSPEDAARVMLYKASHGDLDHIDELARRTMNVPLSRIFRYSSNYADAYGTYTLYRERWHESMRSYRAVFNLINAEADTQSSRDRMLADIFVAQVGGEAIPTMKKIRQAAHIADDVLPDMCFEEDYEQCYEALERVVEGLPVWEDYI
ncbi:hypothetical protein Moror_8180 [Moniliophthora roreri MCA 2997]|uniref:Uncharacterized protein n=1 Tax=Moniliophthora roreri (strain MCA 2997) TaxID=1381753 RepID=V2XND1_MONRO|nr:hypothetical protein Moror_8180 [Moniliophthora roreri MCA 2997]KAI3606339.1 hypothetical protein WG66_009585 [Moniliophthora roreri]